MAKFSIKPTEINKHMPPPRKGARRMADIDPAILAELNAGRMECVTLVESLAVDFALLLKNTLPNAPMIEVPQNLGWVQRMRIFAQHLYDHDGLGMVPKLQTQRADTLRGWAACILGLAPELPLAERLVRIKRLADDPNPLVRESAWLFLRDKIIADIHHSVALLTPWTDHASANVRRFAVESTRPRGVWCAHAPDLKADPALGLPLLQPLHNDPSRYVQNSVANWLNDAGKSQPDWVNAVTEAWLIESPTLATHYIVKRARRNLA